MILSFNALQAFVSEYAVTGKDAGTGSLLAALAEAGFLIGLEKNRSFFFLIKHIAFGHIILSGPSLQD